MAGITPEEAGKIQGAEARADEGQVAKGGPGAQAQTFAAKNENAAADRGPGGPSGPTGPGGGKWWRWWW